VRSRGKPILQASVVSFIMSDFDFVAPGLITLSFPLGSPSFLGCPSCLRYVPPRQLPKLRFVWVPRTGAWAVMKEKRFCSADFAGNE
jgi:hypothetical protein